MERLAKWIVKCRVLILLVALALLVPSVAGYMGTYVNYDILSYLPPELESMIGQSCLENDFEIASTAMITVEKLPTHELLQMKEEIMAVPGVKNVLWQDNLLDAAVPPEMLPEELRCIYYRNDATLMLVTFTDKTSAQSTMTALEHIEKILRHNCFMGGISAIEANTKNLFDREMPIYVVVAVLLSALVLSLGLQYFLVPFVFIIGIGFAVVYNMGTNIFFGQICYITKALASVLQLGVTTDFSIFLLDRYDEELQKGQKSEEAMTHAITSTFLSIAGSSTTTIAGFLAMCTMSLTLGRDIGLVMAKGVLIGVLCTVIVLPALILFFDKPIHRFTHRTLIPKLPHVSAFAVKHRFAMVLAAVLLFVPFYIAQHRVPVYYTLFDSLPQDLPAIVGTNKMKDDFNMATTHFVLVNDGLQPKEMSKLVKDIKKMDGMNSVVAVESFLGAGIPQEFIPQDIKDIFEAGGKKMLVVNTSVRPGTQKMTRQLDDMNALLKSYDPGALIAGEGAMSNDLVRVADVDFQNVNFASILMVFCIIALVFRSISIPVLLVCAIELAISINMGISYFTGAVIPFISSIVIGTIQLGATVDYAILMTTRYQEERRGGRPRLEAAQVAAQSSTSSILISGLTFFAANIGVVLVSKIELIKSLCLMLARGALVSMVVILLLMPAILAVFSGVIEKTSYHFLKEKNPKQKAQKGA